VLIYIDYPILTSADLLTAVDELKMIETDNHFVALVDVLSLATKSKNLMVAKEKMISSEYLTNYMSIYLVILLLDCIDDYSSYAVMATVYSKLHDTANIITSCQRGCDVVMVTTSM